MKNFLSSLLPDLDSWQEIILSMKQNKARVLLTAFGIYWGVFMLVVMLGVSKGFENGVVGGLDIAKNTVFLWTQSTSKPYKGYQPGRNIALNYSDAIAIRERIPEAAFVAPRLVLSGARIRYQSEEINFSAFGDEPDFLQVKPLDITQGRFLNKVDIDQKRKIVVIGKRVKELLFKEEDPIGKYIAINGIPFKVVGVFNSRASGEQSINDIQSVYLPITTMQSAFQMSNRVQWFAFLPSEGVDASVVETKTVELLKTRHHVHPDDQRAFGVANIATEFEQINMIFLAFKGFSWLVAMGTLFAAAVGVVNIMMFVVKERTLEIGIRKAVGATPFSIVFMITKEALLLTFLAGYLGLLTGLSLVETLRWAMIEFQVKMDFFGHPEIDFSVVLSALLVLFVAGTIAGLIPGTKAAKIEAVEALRTAD